MTPTFFRAGLAAALLLSTAAVAGAQTKAPATTSRPAGTAGFPIAFDSVEAYLMSLVPPDGRKNVKNLALSGQQRNLQVDADVNLGGVQGLELFGAFGFTHVTAVGPMQVLKPGLVAWNVQSLKVGGTTVSPAVWGPVLRRGTKRDDTLVPFKVGEWVKQVEVEPTRLVLR